MNREEHRHEATELIRTLVDKVVLTPDENRKKKLKMNLYGDLAGILSMASGGELKQEDMLTQTFFEHAPPAGALTTLGEKQESNNAGAVAEMRPSGRAFRGRQTNTGSALALLDVQPA